MIRRTLFPALLCALLLSGCASSGPKGAAAFSSLAHSNAGNYQVRLKGPTELTAGQAFDLDVEIFQDEATGLRPGAVVVDLDGERQGTGTRLPDVAATLVGAGHYRFEGMSLDEGVWDIFVDVTQGAVTERAQVRVSILAPAP